LPKLTLAAERTAARWNGLRLVYATMAYGTRCAVWQQVASYNLVGGFKHFLFSI
jgi:hypothetical protein